MARGKWLPYSVFGLAALMVILCAVFGAILTFRGVAGQTHVKIFSWEISTTVSGLAALFIGCASATGLVLNYRRAFVTPIDAYALYLFVALEEINGLITETHQLRNSIQTDADLSEYHARRIDEWVSLHSAFNRLARSNWLGHAGLTYGNLLREIRKELDIACSSLSTKLVLLRQEVANLKSAKAQEAAYRLVFNEAARVLEEVARGLESVYERGRGEIAVRKPSEGSRTPGRS